jgi:hypothetical protein
MRGGGWASAHRTSAPSRHGVRETQPTWNKGRGWGLGRALPGGWRRPVWGTQVMVDIVMQGAHIRATSACNPTPRPRHTATRAHDGHTYPSATLSRSQSYTTVTRPAAAARGVAWRSVDAAHVVNQHAAVRAATACNEPQQVWERGGAMGGSLRQRGVVRVLSRPACNARHAQGGRGRGGGGGRAGVVCWLSKALCRGL